jgi:EmrB/QacA subfamily drug resistance transporter
MLALLAMGVAVLVIANDFTALSVALPQIEQDFRSDITSVQWVINSYALVFGVLIVPGGRLADLFGRRRIFFLGTTLFAGFSLVGGFAPNIGWLIACRVLMGMGGALMWPAMLGMTFSLLPREKAGLAGGLIIGAAGFGNAVGPLIGGVLTDSLGWEWIFFLNVPVSLLAILITWSVVHIEEAPSGSRSIDVRGVLILTAGLVALLVALDQGSSEGWASPEILALFLVAAIALFAFAVVERRAGEAALIPPEVLSNRNFASAGLAVLLMSAVFFAALIYLPQYMTKALGYSAVGAGLGLLPLLGTFALVSFGAGPLYGRLGPKLIVSTGALFLTVGLGLLAFIHPSSTYEDLVPGMIVLGTGIGLFYSSATTSGVTAVDPARTSLAGGLIYMAKIAGGSVGLGLTTALVASQGSLAQGIRLAFTVDAILAAGGLAVSVLFVGGEVDRARIRHLPWHHRAHA